MDAVGALPEEPDRDPDVDDDFSSPTLSVDLWIDHYLPHWTVPERSQARYGRDATGLHLRIDHDQLDWREEDAPLRVSNLQTGNFSGPIGSARGTHRHRPDLRVRTDRSGLLWAPSAGRVEVTVSATRDPGCMLAAWLVGAEDRAPEECGEICLFEIDADRVGRTRSWARSGVKAHGDPRLVTDMAEVALPFDASRPHSWTVIWDSSRVVIGCDGRIVRRVDQGLSYPLILMVDLFETGGRSEERDAYPKSASVHRVRGWSSPG